jgi:hypothetical protein
MNRVVFFLFLGAALLVSGSVSAQINIVNIANGDVAGLKAAITAANSNGEDDIINLATNGTYTLTTVDNVTTGATGLPVIGPDSGHGVTIHGHGSTLTRSGSTPFRILQIAANSNVSIDSLTISNALIANFGPGTAVGAGIYNSGGTLTLTSCTLNSNTVQGRPGGDGISNEPNGNPGDDAAGGAIYDTGALTLTGCAFNNNSVVGGKGGNGFGASGSPGNGGQGSGGAIYGPPTAVSCTFSGNTATGGNGGSSAIGLGFGGDAAGGAIDGGAIASKSSFTNNSASPGSGSAGGAFDPPGHSYGGALAFTGTISESTFINNSAQEGGALLVRAQFLAPSGAVTGGVTSCFFQNNTASIAGGVAFVTDEDDGIFGYYIGLLSMTDCTVSTCSAPHGAVVSLNDGSDSTLGQASLVNCTLDGNNASASGAGSLENGVGLTNSILKTGTTGANVASNGITSHGHNISNDSAAGLLTATGDKPNTDPFFVSDIPQDNGGPTKTIAIGIFGSSPAINAGDDGAAPHRDQRGYFRTGQSDIGAYEYFGGLTGSSSIARNGNDAVISAEVVYGHSYQLERKLNLTDASWTPLGNEFVATDNDIESATASGDFSLGHAFYHIRFTN